MHYLGRLQRTVAVQNPVLQESCWRQPYMAEAIEHKKIARETTFNQPS
jgi:hypothetical protein